MSGPYPCTQCGGLGQTVWEDDYGDHYEECTRCKDSGYMVLKTAGPGYPRPDDPHPEDPYESAPKGVNW